MVMGLKTGLLRFHVKSFNPFTTTVLLTLHQEYVRLKQVHEVPSSLSSDQWKEIYECCGLGFIHHHHLNQSLQKFITKGCSVHQQTFCPVPISLKWLACRKVPGNLFLQCQALPQTPLTQKLILDGSIIHHHPHETTVRMNGNDTHLIGLTQSREWGLSGNKCIWRSVFKQLRSDRS